MSASLWPQRRSSPAILAHLLGQERFHRGTLLGFLVAFSGVILVVCNGTFVLKLNPRGDLLALAAAGCWAVYSVLLRHVSQGLDPVLVTRRTMFWGILTALPIVILEGAPYPLSPLFTPVVAGNLLFLGLIGSALCFVLWNKAFRLLGVVTTNNFIYLNPFVTVVAARLVLRSPSPPWLCWEQFSSPPAWWFPSVPCFTFFPKKQEPVNDRLLFYRIN